MADTQETRTSPHADFSGASHSLSSQGEAVGAPGWNHDAQVIAAGANQIDQGARVKRGFRTVLKNHYFLRLWMAQLISQTIMNAANYGLVVLIAQRSSSYLATSFAIVAFALPAMLFGAPAGVLVDRFDRRRVLWISNILRAVAAFIFSVSLFLDEKAILPAYAVSFFIATVGQFFTPAEGAAIPLLVHQEELINALSLFNITFTIAQALGLIVLAPAIVAFTPVITIGSATRNVQVQPIDTLFLIVGLLYVACAVLILTIPKRKLRLQHPERRAAHTHETDQLRSIWLGIVECSRFILADRRLLIAVLQLSIGGTIVAIVATIAPGFVQSFFNRPPEQAVLVFFPAGIGLVLGSAFTPKVVRHIGYNTAIGFGIVLFAVSATLLVVVHAIALDFVTVPAQTVMQERSPDWIKGRVLSVQAMILNGVTVAVVPLMGFAADRFGIAIAVVILAIVVTATGLPAAYLAAHTHGPAENAAPSERPLKQTHP
jgi:MFS family permease